MLTDALLAVWILPIIHALHMRAHAKAVVMWLFGSRLVICVVDIGRMYVIHQALHSEDQTRESPHSPSYTPPIFPKIYPYPYPYPYPVSITITTTPHHQLTPHPSQAQTSYGPS
jgi:hypothetical protein